MLRNCCPTAVEGVLHLPRPRRDPSPDDPCGLRVHVQDELPPAQRKMLLLLREQGEEGRQRHLRHLLKGRGRRGRLWGRR